MKLIAEAEEFAPLITFLLSAPANYITGQTIAVDGGVTSTLFIISGVAESVARQLSSSAVRTLVACGRR